MLETLLNEGWSYHDRESERLAAELESAVAGGVQPDQADPFVRLSNHTIGEHLGDWSRARRLADQVLAAQSADLSTARAWLRVSVARLMDNDAVGATHAELNGLVASGSDFGGALVEARFMLVAAMVGSKRAGEAQPIYGAALALADGLGEAAPARAIAVASNNLASELLEAPPRSADETALMRAAADAAHQYWRRCGTWVNDERALYLKALVANALGEPRAALAHADAALDLIAANGEEPVDQAFLRLARSKAYRFLDDPRASAEDLAAADAAADGWTDEGLRSWYAEERAKATAR
jgi:hypothetical protein